MDDEGLKAQFNKLQEQQLRKLQRKNELRGSLATSNNQKVKGNASSDTGISLRDSLWQSDEIDNLELALDDGVDINEDDEEEEDESAQIQMRELRDENGRLYKLLKEREEELKLVKRRWKEEKKELTGQNVGADGAAKTVMELSKKNRELSMEIERERTKNSELEKKLHEAKAKAMVSQNFVVASSSSDLLHERDAKEEDTDGKALLEKLAQSNSRVTELRVQVDNYKEELKLAHKILAKEVGEGVSIQALLGGSTNWKGRQQQIIQLQNKISELQMKISNMHSPSPRFSSVSSLTSSFISPSLGDDKYRALLKKVDLERKEVVEKQKQDFENLERDFKKVSDKFDAAKARNSVLSVELKGLKAQITTLTDKGKHDDELISTLLQEQGRLKEQISKLKRREGENQGPVIYKGNAESELVTKLQEQVKFQQEKVASLEAELRSLHKPGSSKARKLTSANKRSLLNFPVKEGAVNSDLTFSSKGDSEFEEQLKEHKIQLQEARSFQRVAEVERDRLLELVQLLEKRIDENSQGNLRVKEELIETKRQNAKLEKQVERYKNAKGAPGFVGNVRPRGLLKQSKQSSSNLEKTAEDYQFEIGELQARLEIQQDSNEALKHALDSTLKAKKKDVAFYQDMLEQTKSIFLSGLKEFKQNIAV